MNKRELTILLLMPILAVCISYYGVYQIDTVNRNHQANIDITSKIEDFAVKIKSENPEQTQRNLINHIESTNQLLAMELNSGQLYINVIHTHFRDAVIISATWVLLVMAVYFTSNKRRAK
ncbi:MAG: hypothetical protein OEZ15_02140 [Gammaproteobacteria bacterium]|nr:hypothetical protein [Gammaproteobacteria bacterium]